jgi:hypothetical protein
MEAAQIYRAKCLGKVWDPSTTGSETGRDLDHLACDGDLQVVRVNNRPMQDTACNDGTSACACE